MNREPIKVVGDIIKNFMSLTDDQIFIYNQDYKLPETSGLFVVMQYNTSENFSSVNEFIPAPEGQEGGQQKISILMKESYTINVVSKNDEARQRKEEVIMALNSNYSQDEQGKEQFQIARISDSFTNVSELEGAGMLNRFAINISLLAFYDKLVDTTYYDTFTNQINVE